MFNYYDYGNSLNSDMHLVVRMGGTTYKQRHKNWRDRVIAVARGIIFDLLHQRNYYSLIWGGVLTVHYIPLDVFNSIGYQKVDFICTCKFLTILPANAGERVNLNDTIL